ncbi:alpha/beta fold hydrolase [uncultured Bradyrhizobium sp.]|uniref:alpha/beta fold hydrolase n=1 Tax=uncultured Bradyrhizobium sp. TaxID=199684 RepID=UPI003433F433
MRRELADLSDYYVLGASFGGPLAVMLAAAEPQRVRSVACHGLEQGGDVLGTDGTIGDAAHRRRDLDHRLQPMQSARAGPDDLDREASLLRDLLERRDDVIGADGDCGRIAGNGNLHVHRCASATSASRRFSSSRPTRRPSSIADGAVEHRPRQ